MRFVFLFAIVATRSVVVVNGLPSSSRPLQSSSHPSGFPRWPLANTKKNEASDLDVFGWLEELIQSRSLKNITANTTRSKDGIDPKDPSSTQEQPSTTESRTGVSNATRLAGNKIRTVLLLGILKLVMVLHLEVFVVRNLPDRVLLEIVKLCIARDARPKVLRLVATELDRRVQNYKLDEIAKSIVCSYTGKRTYQFGDITRTVLREAQKRHPRTAERIQKQLDIFQKESLARRTLAHLQR